MKINPRFLLGIALAAMSLSALGVPASASSTGTNLQMRTSSGGGMGPNEFGKTDNYDAGYLTQDVYTHGFYCDTSVPSGASTGCEVGATFKTPPAKNFDPLYIVVPIGFSPSMMQMQCPNGLTCVDHPATIDLSAIGLPSNSPTPGHIHFTTTTNGGVAEWWDVLVIGCTNPDTYYEIQAHQSFAYLQALMKRHNKNVTQPIPTNLFLFFAVRPAGQ